MVFSERVRNYGSRGKGVSARDNHIIKGMKALHLLAALAWAGGAFSMQALGFLKLGMDDPATVKLVEYCRYIVDSWVVMPGLIGCVLTGLFYSIFTSLGFFKFAWVTIKWIISFCAGFWGTFFWLPVGDRCIEWLTPMGLDWPLRFVRSSDSAACGTNPLGGFAPSADVSSPGEVSPPAGSSPGFVSGFGSFGAGVSVRSCP